MIESLSKELKLWSKHRIIFKAKTNYLNWQQPDVDFTNM